MKIKNLKLGVAIFIPDKGYNKKQRRTQQFHSWVSIQQTQNTNFKTYTSICSLQHYLQ